MHSHHVLHRDLKVGVLPVGVSVVCGEWHFACLLHTPQPKMAHTSTIPLQPANVFLTPSGRVKVGDVGLSCLVDERVSNPKVCSRRGHTCRKGWRRRASGRVAGLHVDPKRAPLCKAVHPTIADPLHLLSQQAAAVHVTPEALLHGHDGFSQESDLWSLGCLLYELARLHPPFTTQEEASRSALFERAARVRRLVVKLRIVMPAVGLVNGPKHSQTEISTPNAMCALFHDTQNHHRATTPRSPRSTARSCTILRTRSSWPTRGSGRTSTTSASSLCGCVGAWPRRQRGGSRGQGKGRSCRRCRRQLRRGWRRRMGRWIGSGGGGSRGRWGEWR